MIFIGILANWQMQMYPVVDLGQRLCPVLVRGVHARHNPPLAVVKQQNQSAQGQIARVGCLHMRLFQGGQRGGTDAGAKYGDIADVHDARRLVQGHCDLAHCNTAKDQRRSTDQTDEDERTAHVALGPERETEIKTQRAKGSGDGTIIPAEMHQTQTCRAALKCFHVSNRGFHGAIMDKGAQ